MSLPTHHHRRSRRGRSLVAFVLAVSVAIVSMLAVATPCYAAIALADTSRLIGEEVEEWEDTSSSASAADALARGDFRSPSRTKPNHGFTRSAFFYRFALRNSASERRAFVLHVTRSWVPDVDLYRVRDGVAEIEARAGEGIARAKREIPSEEPAVVIELGPGEERTYLLRLAGTGVIPIPIALVGEISPKGAYFEERTRIVLLWGAFYGALLAMALSTAIVFTVLRDPQWRLAPALFGVTLLKALTYGHVANALPFVVPELMLRGTAFADALTVVSLSEWARVVLRTRLAPRLDLLLRTSAMLSGALCLLGGLLPRWSEHAVFGLAFAFTSLPLVGVLRWRSGHAAARPFVLAMGSFIVSFSLCGAAVLGYLPLHPALEHGSLVGAVIMSALFVLCAHQEMRATRSDLEAKSREVTALGDDLRDQVVQRSRELTRVLERQEPSPIEAGLDPGRMFDERYRVVRPLGVGGMGAVYEVTRTRDDRRFALKVLTSARSTAAVLRLTREAEIGAKLRHPNLVSIVNVGLRDGRAPFLVMDLVRGGSLEEHRARFGDVVWALHVLRGVAAGLLALHDAGVIHRDLKPSNVLLDGDVARICDFGIAKQCDDDDARATESDDSGPRSAARPRIGTGEGLADCSRLTTTGTVVGTPLYMAPEAAAKAPLTSAADMFAFGLLAFELLTGEYPLGLFAPESVVAPTLARVVGLSRAVQTRLEACVSTDPARRPTACDLDALLRSSTATSAA